MKHLSLLLLHLTVLCTSLSAATINVLRLKGHNGSSVYSDIVQNTSQFGSDSISYSTYYGDVTLSVLNTYSPDVLVISNPSGGNDWYTTDEKDAILDYLNQEDKGKGILGEGYVFNSIGDTRPKLHFMGPIFGFRDGIIYDNLAQEGVYNIHPEYQYTYLFDGLEYTYTSSGFLKGNLPSDGGWSPHNLSNATIVASNSDTNSVITFYDASNYRAVYVSVWAAYTGSMEDQRFIYNAYRSIYYKDSMMVVDPLAPTLQLNSFYESNSGESITIDATPTDGYPTDYTYQWYFNSSPVSPSSGGTSSSLTLTGNSFDDGTWKVEVTNDTGTTTAEFNYRVYADSDSDGLSDGREEFILGTDPNNNDSDGDTLLDGVETNTGIWVSTSDTGTNPLSNDTDGDGLSDGVETNTGEYVDASDTGTDPLNSDTDGDGLLDGTETNTVIYVSSSDTGTDPLNNDSDSDGILDGYETATGSWLSSEDTGTNPTKADSDADGLSDGVETNSGVFVGLSDTGTDPNSQDSDGDGFTDQYEINTSYDPTSSEDTPDTVLVVKTAIELEFHGASGGTYRIEHSTDLGSWVTVEDNIQGESALVERLHSVDNYSRRFFRVVRTDQ